MQNWFWYQFFQFIIIIVVISVIDDTYCGQFVWSLDIQNWINFFIVNIESEKRRKKSKLKTWHCQSWSWWIWQVFIQKNKLFIWLVWQWMKEKAWCIRKQKWPISLKKIYVFHYWKENLILILIKFNIKMFSNQKHSE